MDGDGEGSRPAVCATMEGTTFRKSRVFREKFFELDREYLKKENGLHLSYLECEDTTLAGTAIAGLLNLSF